MTQKLDWTQIFVIPVTQYVILAKLFYIFWGTTKTTTIIIVLIFVWLLWDYMSYMKGPYNNA